MKESPGNSAGNPPRECASIRSQPRGCSVSLVADIGELKPGVLSVEDAARWLSLGRTVTYRLIGEGRLRSFTVGRRRLVPLAACEEYVADRLAETAE